VLIEKSANRTVKYSVSDNQDLPTQQQKQTHKESTMHSDIKQKALSLFYALTEAHNLKGNEYLTTEFDHILTSEKNLSTWNRHYPNTEKTILNEFSPSNVYTLFGRIVTEEEYEEKMMFHSLDVHELLITVVGNHLYISDDYITNGISEGFSFCPHHKYSLDWLQSVDVEALDLTINISVER